MIPAYCYANTNGDMCYGQLVGRVDENWMNLRPLLPYTNEEDVSSVYMENTPSWISP